MNLKNKYDVIIAGGGTAGVSCAWNCGKHGLKALIIEQNSFLGGTMTSSLVVPAMKISDNAINIDFYNEFYNVLHKMNGSITYSDGNKGWFNPELAKIALDKMMADAGVDVIFESRIDNIKAESHKILSISIEQIYNVKKCCNNDTLLLPIVSTYYVDATGDAKIFQKLNCKFLENYDNNSQPINLRFIMSGVNVEKFTEWIMSYDKNRDVTSACTVEGNTYMSTAYTWDNNVRWALKPIFEQGIADGIITEADSNYFQVFSVAGTTDSIAFNAPRLLDYNKRDSNAYAEGRAAIYRLSVFCKKYLPGFENAHISSIANSLGVRVSNRIKGKYVYKYDDLVNGKSFDNPVLISNYPVDIHSDKKDNSKLEKVLKEYQLPIESLFSSDYDNLFAIGRCISADFKAQAALRIIPSCFSMGEGLAKYFASSD